MKIRYLSGLVAMGILALSSVVSASPTYPDRPVNLVVTFPPGGGTDATMRAFAKAFQEVTGQPMTVENRPGGGTMIGLNYLKGKAPDGYNLGLSTAAQFSQYWINEGKVPVDPYKDLDYLVGTHGSIFGLLAGPDAPYSTLDELVAFAKANPNRTFSIGNIGQMAAHHMAAVEFARLSGIPVEHVTFKGEGESNTAAMGGHIDMSVSSGSFIPFVQGGRLKLLGLATEEPLPEFPEWKTFRQQGYDVVVGTQIGLAAPKGISPELIARIEEIVREVTKNPDFVSAANRLYQPVQFQDHATYQATIKEQAQEQRMAVETIRAQQK